MVARNKTSESVAETKTVFLPCAGLGSRLLLGSSGLPKPLQDLGGIPAIARIIDYYPEDWNIVIALGHDGQIVRDSIEAIFFDSARGRRLSFTHTDSYKEKGKGLSHTILDAHDALIGKPFVFHAADTILKSDNTKFVDSIRNENQIFFAKTNTSGRYRYLTEVAQGGALGWAVRDFQPQEQCLPYIGVSHVYDWSKFWKLLEAKANLEPEGGESLGIEVNESNLVNLHEVDWFDIGTREGLQAAEGSYPHERNILQKSNEAIWFYDSRVVKVHKDPVFISGRVERARNLAPFVPKISHSNLHTYSYSEVVGQELSKVLERPDFNINSFWDFLWLFWTSDKSGHVVESEEISAPYLEFYRDKTLARVGQLTSRFPSLEAQTSINGMQIRSMRELLEDIPWEDLSKISRSRVHGDLHPENILVDFDDKSFTLLDWRQDLAGSIASEGDIYYDLGKLAHGFRVDHGVVKKQGYSVSGSVDLGFTSAIEWAPGKELAYQLFQGRVRDWGLSWEKVVLMESVIYLNIAFLHDPDEYSLFLALLGRLQAEKALQKLSNETQAKERAKDRQ